MGNKDKKFKKCKRKIKIRLADPNDPDSYICEVFDSSLENENEDEVSKNINFLPKSKEGTYKPKDYFDLLMSKDCRRSSSSKAKSKTKLEENCDPLVITIEDNDEDHSKIHGTNQERKENGISATQKDESESSDDESLQTIKRKCEAQNTKEKICEVTPRSAPGNEQKDDELYPIFESPKVESNKKTLSILNYFSKTNPKNTGAQKNCTNLVGVKNSKIIQKKNNLVGCKNVENSSRTEKKLCLNGLNKENLKLAPLFCKKEKKILDPAVQKARYNFLYNSLHSSKKKDEKCNDTDVKFREVVHVQQKNDSPLWSSREVILPFTKTSTTDSYSNSDKKFRFGINKPNLISVCVSSSTISVNKDLIRKLKSKYLNLNLEPVIDNLKRKRDKFQCFLEERDKKENLKNGSSDDTDCDAVNTLWVEKYKPDSSDILGNGKTPKKLRDWLESWKSFDEALKTFTKNKAKGKLESDEDDDVFLDSDDDNHQLTTPVNVCILSGPHASGKTALVFALANELEYQVLEINASSKRTGRKILNDLQEATQSHKVHHRVKQNEIPVKEGKKKKKHKKSKKVEDASRSRTTTRRDCKISLILIEDADIIFEDHDEGFIPAVSSLAHTSKRPLIFIANEPNYTYLDGFKKDQCLILKMQRPCFYKTCAMLDIVSSLEGVHTDEEFLKHIVRRNYSDLRKSLLELQFWTHVRDNPLSIRKEFDLGQLWWGLGKFLYKKDFKNCITSNGCKRKRRNDLFDSSDDDEELAVKKPKLNSSATEDVLVSNPKAVRGKANPIMGSYVKLLDLVSTVASACVSSYSESIFEFEHRPKDSLSLEENLEEMSSGRENLTMELSEELVKLSTQVFAKDLKKKKNEERKFDFASSSWEEIRWQQSQIKVTEELLGLVPLQSVGDKRGLRLDYFPIIRNMCRSEKSRTEVQAKRKNRFYHYLMNLGANLDDYTLETNCKIFSR